MRISSFDIFDTCLLRKCGTPENFFDVLSWCAFYSNVEEEVRQEFIAARSLAQHKAAKASMTLQDIWDSFDWNHPTLKSREDLYEEELELERSMLTPSRKMLEMVNKCRENGDKILFISDMYLSSSFLISVLEMEGFYKEGDGLYVSCECNAEKWNGSLFRYVYDKEQISYRNWHHYGDNYAVDYQSPHRLGIRVHKVVNEYTPFQQMWRQTCYTFGFPTLSIMAGLGRSFICGGAANIDAPLVYDVIAPFYCTMAYRMMRDADAHGIKRLYFCARDTYMLYHVALSLGDLFPNMSMQFLYISKQSLYYGNDAAKGLYFEQQGLASTTEKTAIVDLHSSGKTLVVLNEWMKEHGYNEVRGYYYQMFVRQSMEHTPSNYYTEVNAINICRFKMFSPIISDEVLQLQEWVFGMNTLSRTIDYEIQKGVAKPIFDKDNVDKEELQTVICKDKEKRVEEHKQMLATYAQNWKKLQLFRYADELMNSCVVPSLCAFLSKSPKCYLEPLLDLTYVRNDGSQRSRPFIKKCGIIELLLIRGRNAIWNRGTLYYSCPEWMANLIMKIMKRNEC